MDTRVVPHDFQVCPPGIHAGRRQGSRELAFQRGAAMRDGVALHESRFVFCLVAGLPDRD